MWPILLMILVLAIITLTGVFEVAIPFALLLIALAFFGSGIRLVRPTHRGLIERLGNYRGMARPGFNWIIPFIDKMIKVNITEQWVDAKEQIVITKDRLNAKVDAQVYFKVKDSEQAVKDSQYNVDDHITQIIALSQTNLRNIIGNMNYQDANSKRNKINVDLLKILEKEAKPWGIQIVRTEIKEIEPPKNVQESMNAVLTAENEKKASIDLATATEHRADGERRAKIKEAQGVKESLILRAEGEAQSIEKVAQAIAKKYKVENESLIKYFKGNAQIHKKLDAMQRALQRNSKFVFDSKSNITNVMSEVAGVTPIPKRAVVKRSVTKKATKKRGK